MTTTSLDNPHHPPQSHSRTQETLEAAWQAASGRHIEDDLLRWPPDVFALTNTILRRTEAYRFVVSPPTGKQWAPLRDATWGERVDAAARAWCDWARRASGPPPGMVATQWAILREATTTPLDDVASGREWQICMAVLTLHAIADQACAGVAARVNAINGTGGTLHTLMRSLLGSSGSMSRIDPGRLRVLPKYRTQAGGISVRSISRYAFVAGPDVDFQLHQLTDGRPVDLQRQLNLLLLPWPMSVSARDFRPVPASVHDREVEPFGYFQFDPSERLDLSLADDVFSAAKSHVDYIDMAVLPESALSEDDLSALQEVAAHHGIEMIVAGVRSSHSGGDFTPNWVQFAAHTEAKWSHYRQEKHHRWSLDRRQIEQYQLEKALSPEIRWWEAMEIAPRAIQLLEHPDGHTVSSLVCEDLAHMDDAVELLRSIGPTLILGLLLDGPQLASRWTSRYAGILADDPGSAVLTLSSYGMVRRSWHSGQTASSTIALWKDHNRGAQEITLATGAHGVLLTTDLKPTLRRAADGRQPEPDAAELTYVGTTQIVVPPGRRRRRHTGPDSSPR